MSGDEDTPRAGEERTVFAAATPPTTGDQAPPRDAAAADAAVSPPPPAPPSAPPAAPRQGIQVGDILNHIFEVKRFIARGGMGEVFEGANINSDERVAIKVMLPSLAADPNVIAMFRKEARTLTRLNHEGLVSYRVLAQEPVLGVLYIVTEYIDGTNLADVLGTLRPTPAQMVQMLRRMAAGLRAAHALGAIHRDLSPDNVILEEGDATRAKVIDFGIAKDLDPGSATIVGDGFAGKLNYVAPEQLGDFNREIGPWSDVYSLGLVMLAVAGGRPVQMGGTLVDAVDKRRAGPDLSVVPPELRPILEKMLRPSPQDRLRSMDAVLDAIGERSSGPAIAEPAPVIASSRGTRGSRIPLLAGVAGGIVALAAAAWFVLAPAHGPARGGNPAAAAPGASDVVQVARETIETTLPSVACTWLNIADVANRGGRLSVSLTGVAGDPSAAANEISRALGGRGVSNADINFDAVSPITRAGCAALDGFRQIRATDAQRLSVPQPRFAMRMQPPGSAYAGKLAANAIINLDIADPSADLALIGLEPSGMIDPIINGRQAFAAQVNESKDGKPLAALGDDRYRLQLDLDHVGWSGILLLTGKGPFDPKLVAPGLGERGPDWLNRFVSTATANGWKAEMVWFQSVDSAKQ